MAKKETAINMVPVLVPQRPRMEWALIDGEKSLSVKVNDESWNIPLGKQVEVPDYVRDVVLNYLESTK